MKKLLSIILTMFVFLSLSCTESILAEEANTKVSEKTLNTLKEYMEKDLKMRPERTQENLSKFEKHPDICLEFEQWIIHRTYKTKKPVKVEGYTAEDISNLAPFMKAKGIGVYNFLITLREDPESALGYIKEGFRKL